MNLLELDREIGKDSTQGLVVGFVAGFMIGVIAVAAYLAASI